MGLTCLVGGACCSPSTAGRAGDRLAVVRHREDGCLGGVARTDPPPRVVVTDGGSGLASALKQRWPHTQVQRRFVHAQRNVRTYLANRPRTEAGKALRALSLALARITTREQAAAWQVTLHDWHQVCGSTPRWRLRNSATQARPLLGAASPPLKRTSTSTTTNLTVPRVKARARRHCPQSRSPDKKIRHLVLQRRPTWRRHCAKDIASSRRTSGGLLRDHAHALLARRYRH